MRATLRVTLGACPRVVRLVAFGLVRGAVVEQLLQRRRVGDAFEQQLQLVRAALLRLRAVELALKEFDLERVLHERALERSVLAFERLNQRFERSNPIDEHLHGRSHRRLRAGPDDVVIHVSPYAHWREPLQGPGAAFLPFVRTRLVVATPRCTMVASAQ